MGILGTSSRILVSSKQKEEKKNSGVGVLGSTGGFEIKHAHQGLLGVCVRLYPLYAGSPGVSPLRNVARLDSGKNKNRQIKAPRIHSGNTFRAGKCFLIFSWRFSECLEGLERLPIKNHFKCFLTWLVSTFIFLLFFSLFKYLLI